MTAYGPTALGIRLLLIVSALFLVSACAGTPPTPKDEVYDPLEPMNRGIYNVNQRLDRFIASPLARGYVRVTPEFVRDGVTNFFDNARYPGTIVNGVFQGEWTQSGRDTGRFLINSTVGVLGLFDVARHVGLERNSEDFGKTLAGWGVSEGAHLEVPILGPSNTRDVHDIPVSTATNVITYLGGWTIVLPFYALEAINTRARLDTAARFRSEAALDEYAFTRSAYRRYRNNIIFEGEAPEADLFDELEDW